ncbi:MAG: ABC transporter permease [Actinobacteria bacterium]|nr:ABC transporter permease [Actinomycetota bacterium]
MELLFNGIKSAIGLILSLKREFLDVLSLTLMLVVISTFISTLIGMPVGVLIAINRFRARNFLLALVNAGMGLPPVVVGLFYSILLWRSGPLGSLNILYTPYAIVLGQVTISLPIITGLTCSAVQGIDPGYRLQARALGANRIQEIIKAVAEARLGYFAALIAGFGSIISEVGSVLMLGGNIKGQTRVLTTAIVLETRKGNFELAISLGIVLLLLTLAASYLGTWFQQRRAQGVPRWR